MAGSTMVSFTGLRESGNPQGFLVSAAIGRRDLHLISVERSGRDRYAFHARHLQLHQLYFLLLRVKVAVGGAVAFRQRQAPDRCLAPAAFPEQRAAQID